MIVMGDLGGFGRRFWGAGVPWDGILWRIGIEEVDCLVVSGGINFVISEQKIAGGSLMDYLINYAGEL